MCIGQDTVFDKSLKNELYGPKAGSSTTNGSSSESGTSCNHEPRYVSCAANRLVLW